MGKQVRIYAVPEDFLELERALKAKTNFVAIASRSTTSFLEPSDFVLSSAQMGNEDVHICLAQKEDLPDIIFRDVPAQSLWAIDVMRSPVIQVRRCFFRDGILRQGRLFIETGFYKEDVWQDKPEDFLKWADVVFGIVRKLFRKNPDLNAYVGRHAEAWRIEEGGKFVDPSGSL